MFTKWNAGCEVELIEPKLDHNKESCMFLFLLLLSLSVRLFFVLCSCFILFFYLTSFVNSVCGCYLFLLFLNNLVFLFGCFCH